jgi:hypothetical protein
MKQVRRIADARSAVESLRAPLDAGGTALHQANSGPVAKEFAGDADTRRTRPNNAEIGFDDLIAREFSPIQEHSRMSPSAC